MPLEAVTRVYEKGERRFKHVGSGSEPEFTLVEGSPKKVIGKCPATITSQQRTELLQNAVPLAENDRDLPAPKKVYAVHEGAIYEAQTSDHGRSYHAYPFRGKLPTAIILALATVADAKGCRDEFEIWLKKHIKRQGR